VLKRDKTTSNTRFEAINMRKTIHNRILDLIKTLKEYNDYDTTLYSSVTDKYLNGECVAFVGFAWQLAEKMGEQVDIYFIPINEYGEEEFNERVYHSLFKYNDYFYDITGSYKDLENEINLQNYANNLPFYYHDMKIEMSIYKIDNYNFFTKLDKKIYNQVKNNQSLTVEDCLKDYKKEDTSLVES